MEASRINAQKVSWGVTSRLVPLRVLYCQWIQRGRLHRYLSDKITVTKVKSVFHFSLTFGEIHWNKTSAILKDVTPTPTKWCGALKSNSAERLGNHVSAALMKAQSEFGLSEKKLRKEIYLEQRLNQRIMKRVCKQTNVPFLHPISSWTDLSARISPIRFKKTKSRKS